MEQARPPHDSPTKKSLLDRIQQRLSKDAPALVRPSALEVLAQTELPPRRVTLDDVSLYSLPIHWDQVKALGRDLNQIAPNLLERFELQDFRGKLPKIAGTGLIYIASAIAHHNNPNIPIILPNQAEIEAFKPIVKRFGSFLGKYSPQVQEIFNQKAHIMAKDMVMEIANIAIELINNIGKIEKPRDAFLHDLRLFHERISHAHEHVDFVTNILRQYRDLKNGEYVLPGIIPKNITLPHLSLNQDTHTKLIAAAPEMSKGIGDYLRICGVKNVAPDYQKPHLFELLQPTTWKSESIIRKVAEAEYQDELKALYALPKILSHIYPALPKSGPEVARRLNLMAENILILMKAGHSGDEILDAMVRQKTSHI